MKKTIVFAAVFCILCGGTANGKSEKKTLYKDKNAPIEQRVEDLLSRMTLREKVLQLQNREAGKGGGRNSLKIQR